MSPARSKRFKIIYLELTNICNFTCDYCPIDQQTRKKTHMATDFAERIIDEIADNDLTEFLTFHLMGEPYLHRDLCPLTAHAESRGIKVRLLTNGSLLDSKRNIALFESNLSRLEVGFRTPNDTSFSMRLRGGQLTLEQYISRVRGLISDKLRTKAVTAICIKFFIRSFAAGIKLASEYEHLTSAEDNITVARGLQQFTLRTAGELGISTEGWDAVPIRVVDGEYPIFPGIFIGFSRIQDFWVREQRGQNGKGYGAVVGGCSAGFRDDFGILASGEVTTCCVDYDGRNVIGDLHKHSLMELLESDEAKRIRQSLNRFNPPTPFCKQCLGGPTLASSLIKQISSVAVDIRDRARPRKNYSALRERAEASVPPKI
jgi:MoaA/NifB/PqqE/SkfB family radical SAM enzyme